MALLVRVPDDYASGGSGFAVGSRRFPKLATVLQGIYDAVFAAPKGADLTDAAVTITIAQGRWRVLPAAILSANRIITLGTTGAAAGDRIEITRLDAGAFTLAFVNGGAGAGTLVTLPVSKVNFARFYFDGTNWLLMAVGTQ